MTDWPTGPSPAVPARALEPGTRLGRYRILDRLDRGAMGVVYRARDERLDRDVALKVLASGGDAAALRRFGDEALALSAVGHPNIATVYDYDVVDGVPFIVMELVDGVTTRERLKAGPLAPLEVVRLGRQLAGALIEAHRHGIIHRDLKPANLRVTSDDRLKVLDFGLARRSTAPPEPDGTIAGTLAYMAPEQLAGDAVDARADLYAAGAVLYELATGRPLHADATMEMLAYCVLNEPPRPPREINPAVPEDLERLLLALLDKNPSRRPQDARALDDALAGIERHLEGSRAGEAQSAALPAAAVRVRASWWRDVRIAGPLGVIALVALAFALDAGGLRSRLLGGAGDGVVVLPLRSAGADAEQAAFAEGMTQEITMALGALEPLRVISYTTASRYRDSHRRLPDIARELRVRAVVEGSVRRDAGEVRIQVRMLEARGERPLMQHSFQRRLENVFALQQEVALAVAERARGALTAIERGRIARAPVVDPRANQAYLVGMHHWARRTPDDLAEAVRRFATAVSIDSSFAQGHAMLADALLLLATYGLAAPDEVLPQVRAGLDRAMALDPDLAVAHATRAMLLQDHDWDWRGAEASFRRALELNPSLATARQRHADLLLVLGQPARAIAEIERARDLDPANVSVLADLGSARFLSRDYAGAAAAHREAIALDRDQPDLHVLLALDLLLAGAADSAGAALERALRLEGTADAEITALRAALRRDGTPAFWRWQRDLLRSREAAGYVAPYELARAHAWLGEREPALAALERAMAERSAALPGIGLDPAFDRLRDDPRYRRVVSALGLPAAAR